MNNVIDQEEKQRKVWKAKKIFMVLCTKGAFTYVRRIMSGRRVPKRYPALHIMNGFSVKQYVQSEGGITFEK